MERYIPNFKLKQKLLQELGLKSIEELFSKIIPGNLRIKELNIPEGKSEHQLREELETILAINKRFKTYLGAGIYEHYVPSAVKAIAGRAEFYTAYTPYQPEVSQGILQALFEYQSVLAELLGIDIVNASMYDSATALAEAVLMSKRITTGKEFIISSAIHWEKKLVLKTYANAIGMKLIELPYSKVTGETSLEELKNLLNKDTAGIYLENPNIFGIFESKITELKNIIKDKLLVVCVNPISLGLVKRPGDYGADIVIAEGQVLGNNTYYGGRLLGIFGCRKEYLRQLPGRIVGLTQDSKAQRAFCITLQTREQHIRREKATSNICTNETLCALRAVVYLVLLGSRGLRELAIRNFRNARELVKKLADLQSFEVPYFSGSYFNEFVIKYKNIVKLRNLLLGNNIDFGILLEPFFPELKDTLLCTVTEVHTKEDLEQLVNIISENVRTEK
jgi:glycine dehydrogenase subunit 1